MSDVIPSKERGEISRFKKDVADLFSRFFSGFPGSTSGFTFNEGLFPSVDITEGNDKITVQAEMPGMESNNFDVYITGDELTIKGEKKREKEEKEEACYRKERRFGSFQRRIKLSCEVDESKAEAIYNHGVLKIVMPKLKNAEKKKIEIEVG